MTSEVPTNYPQIIKSKRNFFSLKIIALITVPVVLITLGIGAYWFTTSRVNAGARNISELLLNDESRIQEFLAGSCPSYTAKLNDIFREVENKKYNIDFDYTEALELEGTNTEEARDNLDVWSQEFLESRIGGRASKLENENYVKQDLIKEIENFCELPLTMSEVIASAINLDSTILKINSPGNWQPDGFFTSDEDPNIAWRWAPNYSFSCSAISDGCNRIQVVTKLKCVGSVDVKMGLLYSRTGPSQENEYGNLTDVVPGRTYNLTINHYGYEYDWWRVETISCNS